MPATALEPTKAFTDATNDAEQSREHVGENISTHGTSIVVTVAPDKSIANVISRQQRAMHVFFITAAVILVFSLIDTATFAMTGFSLSRWYLGALSSLGPISSIVAATTAVVTYVFGRMAGLYISGSPVQQGIMKDFGFFLVTALIARPTIGVFHNWLNWLIEQNLGSMKGEAGILARLLTALVCGIGMTTIIEMLEPPLKFLLAARNAEKKGNVLDAKNFREDAQPKNQWPRVRTGIFGRLTFAFTQGNIVQNWVGIEYRIPLNFGLGFFSQIFRALCSYSKDADLSPRLVLASGLAFSLFNFWLVSFWTGVVAVALSVISYFYFGRRTPNTKAQTTNGIAGASGEPGALESAYEFFNRVVDRRRVAIGNNMSEDELAHQTWDYVFSKLNEQRRKGGSDREFVEKALSQLTAVGISVESQQKLIERTYLVRINEKKLQRLGAMLIFHRNVMKILLAAERFRKIDVSRAHLRRFAP